MTNYESKTINDKNNLMTITNKKTKNNFLNFVIVFSLFAVDS